MSRALLSVPVTLLLLALVPGAAGADGLPVPVDGAETASVLAPDGTGFRYATVPDGHDTRLLEIDPNGGAITDYRTIDGEFSVPLVSLDGTASGISGDGGRLVLINPRGRFEFPRRETTFVVVDLADGRMRPQDQLTLRGDFSFDALSPDGSTMYLVEYTSRDYNDYAVREYDLKRQRLLREPVLVAHEVTPDEMRGLPLTRTTSADGGRAYTLYDGGGRRSDEAFIHTLDTERGISHCIDLPMVNGQEAWRIDLVLSDDGGSLDVIRGEDTLATLDTETFALSEPAATPEPPAIASYKGGISGVAVGAIAVGIALVAGTVLGLRRRRHSAHLPADPFGPGEPDATTTQPDSERDRVAT